MRVSQSWFKGAALGMGVALTSLTGCQTYYGGMTLPSPHYLKHSPQYFTPDPTFPLQRELDSMQEPDGALRRGAGAPAPAIAPAPLAITAPTVAAPGR